MATYDIICIGAGPTGLATAIEAKRAGMRPLVIDKACLCNSIFHYPVNMVFFTTPELLEIGDLPLVCAAEKPTRVEALKYYRKAAEHYALELRLYERVLRVDGQDGNFTVVTRTGQGTEYKYQCKKIAVATGGGYFELTSTNDLSSTFRRVADELHHQYALGFTPTQLDGKMHTLLVRVTRAGAVVRARLSYLAFPLITTGIAMAVRSA